VAVTPGRAGRHVGSRVLGLPVGCGSAEWWRWQHAVAGQVWDGLVGSGRIGSDRVGVGRCEMGSGLA
jgi:hypothetical protein